MASSATIPLQPAYNSSASSPTTSTNIPIQPSTCTVPSLPSTYDTTLLQPTCDTPQSPPHSYETKSLQPSPCNATLTPPSNCTTISSQTHDSSPLDVTGRDMHTTDYSQSQNAITEERVAGNETPAINHITQFEDHPLTRPVEVIAKSEDGHSPVPRVIQSPCLDADCHYNVTPTVTSYLSSNQCPAIINPATSEANVISEGSPVSFEVEENTLVPEEILQSDSMSPIGERVVQSTDITGDTEPLGVIREPTVRPHAVIDPLHCNGSESVSRNPIPLQNINLESDKENANGDSKLDSIIHDSNFKRSSLCSMHPSVECGK